MGLLIAAVAALAVTCPLSMAAPSPKASDAATATPRAGAGAAAPTPATDAAAATTPPSAGRANGSAASGPATTPPGQDDTTKAGQGGGTPPASPGKSGSTPAAGGTTPSAGGGGAPTTPGSGQGNPATPPKAGGGKPTVAPDPPPSGGPQPSGGNTTPAPEPAVDAGVPAASTPTGPDTATTKTPTTPKPKRATPTKPKTTSPANGPRSTGTRSVAGGSATPETEPSPTAPRATPSDRRPTEDVVTRIVVQIVEVIPLWAKLLMIALGAIIVAMAFGAHRRLRQRAVDYHHQALHDALTQLPNRALFCERVEDALLEAREDGGQIAVLLIDLDGFKEVNDTLGHSSGDRLLEEVASRLSGAVRDDDTVARLGGDEFAVLLPRVRNAAAAASIATSLRNTLQGLYEVDDISVHTDASIGVAIGPAHGDDADTLLRRADVAMYSAKDRRVGSALYEARLDRYSPERLAIAGELRHAIARGELSLHYQPQVDPRTGRVDAVEALVRWNHPDRGLIGPTEFVPLAERTGLIRPLTLWVLEAAIRECAAWRSVGVDLHVAVNLSTANLVDTELPNAVERLLRRWAVPPEYLRLEITESTAMADPVRTRAVLARLNALGTPLAIDDFGTGYSSLAYLRSLPVRELKIDRSFVSRMTSNGNDAAIVVATIDLAHTLGLRVVAEGVEDRATLRALTSRGCDLVQGYFVARPLAVPELRRWLAAWPGSPWNGPVVAVPPVLALTS